MLNIKRLSMIATLLLLIGILGSLATYKSVSKLESTTEEFTITDFTDIEISSNAGKIELVPTNEENALIEVTGNHLKNNFSAIVTDSTLSITYKETAKKFYNFDLAKKSASVKVYLPQKNYETISLQANNGKLIVKGVEATEITLNARDGAIDLQNIKADLLSVKAINGKLIANELQATEINLNANDGSIDLQQIHADSLSVHSNNGRITADSLVGTTFELKANDGRITLKDIKTDSVAIVSHNGKIELEEITGTISAKANDGSINLVTDKLDHPIDFSTHNGKIHIQTNDDPVNTEIQAQARNGSITIFGEKKSLAVFGSGKNNINLSSNDGRIIVEKQ